ncbi:MAG: tryptophan-rich sensory protein [Rhodobacteraceae bacterium]|nr:tryptophan-rich sensory protein [Paracoccaceae bacterium]
MTMASEFALLGFIFVCFLAAMGGALFRPGAWYETLERPSWRPPNWLFGPAWAVLYAMIAVSGWLVWREVGLTGGALAFAVYAAQLILNFFWSAVFFGLRRIGWALVEMAALWLAILANILVFWPISPAAGAMLIPYLLWVSFAFTLNLAIWRLNPGGAGAANRRNDAAGSEA